MRLCVKKACIYIFKPAIKYLSVWLPALIDFSNIGAKKARFSKPAARRRHGANKNYWRSLQPKRAQSVRLFFSRCARCAKIYLIPLQPFATPSPSQTLSPLIRVLYSLLHSSVPFSNPSSAVQIERASAKVFHSREDFSTDFCEFSTKNQPLVEKKLGIC